MEAKVMKKTTLSILILAASLAAAQTALPTGTAVKMKLETTLATFSNKPGDPFQAKITQPVVVNGATVIPAGAIIEGRVTNAVAGEAISGAAVLFGIAR